MKTLLPVPLLAAALLSTGLPSRAQNATTVPVGAVTVTIPGALNSSTPRQTHISIPLQESPVLIAPISAVTSNSVTLNASVSGTYNSSNPHYLRIRSGSHQGRVFLIVSNSSNVFTLDTQGSILNSLTPPISLGTDVAELIPADTLSSIFGDLTSGSTNPNSADQVWIWSPTSGIYARYYYHTGNQRWQDVAFGFNANNVVVRPDSGFVFLRRPTSDLVIQFLGQVLSAPPQIRILNSGITQISGGFPINTTLSGLSLHTNSNWTGSTSLSTADQVWIWNSSSSLFSRYYYNTTNQRWQDAVFGSNANGVVIPSGASIQVRRFATGNTTYTTYTLPLPYSL